MSRFLKSVLVSVLVTLGLAGTAAAAPPGPWSDPVTLDIEKAIGPAVTADDEGWTAVWATETGIVATSDSTFPNYNQVASEPIGRRGPSLKTIGDGTIVAAWASPDHAIRLSYKHPGGAWSSVVQATDPIANLFSFRVLPNGNDSICLVWLTDPDSQVFASCGDLEGSFDTPVALSPPGQGVLGLEADAGADGSMAIAWGSVNFTSSDYTGFTHVVTKRPGQPFDPMRTVGRGAGDLSVHVGNAGRVTLLWNEVADSRLDRSQPKLATKEAASDAWRVLSPRSWTGMTGEAIYLATPRKTGLIFEGSKDKLIYDATVVNGRTTRMTPITQNDEFQTGSPIRTAEAANGVVTLSWAGVYDSLITTTRIPGGRFSEPTVLTDDFAAGPSIAISSSGASVAAWTKEPYRDEFAPVPKISVAVPDEGYCERRPFRVKRVTARGPKALRVVLGSGQTGTLRFGGRSIRETGPQALVGGREATVNLTLRRRVAKKLRKRGRAKVSFQISFSSPVGCSSVTSKVVRPIRL